jgi:PAS domain-containing protein
MLVLERFPPTVVPSKCRCLEGNTTTISRGGGGATRDLESKYRTLLEQIPAIVYVWGIAGGFEQMAEEYVSPQIEEVLGFYPDDWVENPRLWMDRLHPDDREEVLDETTRSVDAGEPFMLRIGWSLATVGSCGCTMSPPY